MLIQSTGSVNIDKIRIKVHVNGPKTVQTYEISAQGGTMHTKSSRIGTVECKK